MMNGETRLELRKAFAETAVLLAGAIAGGVLGYLLLGDHWAGNWVLPVIGAWLALIGFRHVRRAGAEDS